MSRRVLVCPTCGAPLPPAAIREVVTCAFCASASTPAPESEDKTAPPAVQIARTPAQPTALGCPRCREPLFEGRASDVTLLGCGGCGGIWLDNDSAHAAIRTLDDRVKELSRRAAARATQTPSQEGGVACPACRSKLERVRRTMLEIEVDICHAHGTWFDRGELALMMDAMAWDVRAAKLVAPAPAPTGAPLLIDATPLSPDEIPDFRAGTLTPDPAAAGIVAGGAFAVLGALAALAGKRD